MALQIKKPLKHTHLPSPASQSHIPVVVLAADLQFRASPLPALPFCGAVPLLEPAGSGCSRAPESQMLKAVKCTEMFWVFSAENLALL